MAEQQKFTVKVSKQYNEETRLALGLEIVDFIIERSKAGKDKKNNDFASYSKSYMDSFDFKQSGKSKSKVDLTLSGEMLNAITVLESNEGEITIGIPEDDSFNNAKAEGNIKGTYGGTPKRGKKRDFMGITSKDLAAIKAQYPVKTKADKESSLSKAQNLLISTEASAGVAESFLGKETLDGF